MWLKVYRNGDRLLSIKMVIDEETINVKREWWTIKKNNKNIRWMWEMKMLRGMSEYILKDRISNDHISERVGVTSISEKMRDYRLRWYEHVQRRELDEPVFLLSFERDVYYRVMTLFCPSTKHPGPLGTLN